MMRRLKIYTIFVAFGLTALIVVIWTSYAETSIRKESYPNDTPGQNNTQDEINSYVNNFIEEVRSKIKHETSNYNFSQFGVHSLEDLVLESGGQPLRTVVVSAWRSGSNFLGDLVTNIYPSTYHICEPLLMYRLQPLKTPKDVNKAKNIFKRLLDCKFEGLNDYLDFTRELINGNWPIIKPKKYRQTSVQYSRECENDNKGELCYNAEFTSRLCKLHPFQSIKLIRLRLEHIEELLNDKAFNLKVIRLVRDPRGVMQSRVHLDGCAENPICSDPSVLCADMISDYMAARKILRQYPDRLLVIRFEELALQLNATTDRILNFLKTQRRQAFDDFLQTHTSVEEAALFSTFRVSRNIPFKWKTAVDFNFVNEVQMACSGAMNLWGYKMAHNETHMTSKDFNPIEEYIIE